MKTDDSRRPICAVIILNWNGKKLLPEYLPSVAEGTNPAFGRVIVADNGSTDSSVQLLERDFPGVELLRFTENHGFAEGYNKALRWAMEQGYKYTVLLNSDVRTPAGWLEPLVEYMERHPGCGACQPKLLSDAEPRKFEYAGASGGSSTATATPSAAAAYSPKWKPTTVSTTMCAPCSGPQAPP